MRGFVLFLAGLLCGLAVQTTMAQNDAAGTTGVVLNHVGIAVPSIPDAAAFYMQKMGFKEAFRNSDPQGNPDGHLPADQQDARSSSCSRRTRSVPPASATSAWKRRTSRARSRRIKTRGAMATDPGAPSAFSHAILANVTDLNGLRIELAEMGPESLQRKAMDSWK